MSLPPWYVIHLRSNFERIATQTLEARGFTTFLPLYRVRKTWSDRVKQVEEPLFAGYTFCRLDTREKLPVLTTPGVISIVGSTTGPTPVDDSEILALQAMMKSGLAVSPWPFLREGQSVLVRRGPLEGIEGVVLNVRNKHRLIMSIGLLQRSVSVEIERDWVTPISSRPATPRPGKTAIRSSLVPRRSPVPGI